MKPSSTLRLSDLPPCLLFDTRRRNVGEDEWIALAMIGGLTLGLILAIGLQIWLALLAIQ